MSLPNPRPKLTPEERERQVRARVIAGCATLAVWVALAPPIVGIPATNGMFTLVFAVALLALSPKLWHTKVAAIAGILSALLTTAMIPGLEPGLPNTTGLQVVVALLRVVAVIFAIAAAVTKKTYVKDERLVWEAFVELAKSMRTWVVAIAVGLGLLGFDFLILWFGLPWG